MRALASSLIVIVSGLALLAILHGITATPAPTSMQPLSASLDRQTATVPTATDDERGSVAQAWPVAGLDAALHLHSIAGLDASTAVVGGVIQNENGSRHSAMFLTCDGGRNWQALGPAITDAEVLSCSLNRNCIQALVQRDNLDASPTLLRSDDLGRHWFQRGVTCTAYPARHLSAAELVDLNDGETLVKGQFTERSGEVSHLRSADHGLSWTFLHARPGSSEQLRAGNQQIVTSSGWAWRLVDNLIERRDPSSGVWEAVSHQPSEDYQTTPAVDAVFVKLLRTRHSAHL